MKFKITNFLFLFIFTALISGKNVQYLKGFEVDYTLKKGPMNLTEIIPMNMAFQTKLKYIYNSKGDKVLFFNENQNGLLFSKVTYISDSTKLFLENFDNCLEVDCDLIN